MLIILTSPATSYVKIVYIELMKTPERHQWINHVKHYVKLCYVMLCYVMLCYVMLCYVMLCYVMLCYVMLCSCGFGSIWYNQWVTSNDRVFLKSFEQGNNMQHCLSKINSSSRCRLYKELKQVFILNHIVC